MQNFIFLASRCSLGDWFETRFVGHSDDRFSRDEAIILQYFNKEIFTTVTVKYSTTKETHQSLLGAIMENRMKK